MPRTLTAEALAVADQPTPAPISPIVLAGFVRMGEFALVMLIGLALYAVYLPAMDGLIWRYLTATMGIAVLSTLAFQVADIYQVQAFRGHEKQYFRLASAWSVVFLIVIGASFFAKAGDSIRASGSAASIVVGLVAPHCFRARCCFFSCAAGPARAASTVAPSSSAAAIPAKRVIEELRRQRDSDVDIIGLFDDRGDDRSSADCAGEPQARHRRRSRRVRAAARASIW